MAETGTGLSIRASSPAAILIRMVVVGLLLCSGAWALNRQFVRRAPVNRAILQGVTDLEAAHPTLAEAAWRKAIALDPTRPEPYQLLGDLYVSSGRPAQAIPLLKRLREFAPGTPHTLCLLADAYARTGDDNRALTTAQQAVVVEPNCARAHAVLGIELSNKLQHPRALAELATAHRLDPGNDRITLTLAQAQLNAADLDAAAGTLKSVIAHDAKDSRAWYLLGWCLMRQAPTPENHRGAVDALQHSVSLDPSDLTAAAELGRALAASGNPRGAQSYLEKAWSGGVKTEEVGSNLVSVYQELGAAAKASQIAAELKERSDLASTIASLQKQLAANPHDTDTAIELALLDAEHGDIMSAGGLITAVLRSGRHDRKTTDAALRIYTAASSKRDAQRLLASVLAEKPRQPGGSTAVPPS